MQSHSDVLGVRTLIYELGGGGSWWGRQTKFNPQYEIIYLETQLTSKFSLGSFLSSFLWGKWIQIMAIVQWMKDLRNLIFMAYKALHKLSLISSMSSFSFPHTSLSLLQLYKSSFRFIKILTAFLTSGSSKTLFPDLKCLLSLYFPLHC